MNKQLLATAAHMRINQLRRALLISIVSNVCLTAALIYLIIMR